jgi:hypothetical protein
VSEKCFLDCDLTIDMLSYGARGGAIIQATLYRLFNPCTTKSEAIEPLRYTVYATYVLIPYVAHLLIAEDLSCSAEDAHKIMLESAATGAQLHPLRDDDEELDDIITMNARLARKERNMVRVSYNQLVLC